MDRRSCGSFLCSPWHGQVARENVNSVLKSIRFSLLHCCENVKMDATLFIHMIERRVSIFSDLSPPLAHDDSWHRNIDT